MFSNSMRTSAMTTATAARLSLPILIRQQQPTSFVNYRHHLFSASSAFALRLPKVSRLTARVFLSFQVAMGDAPDAGKDAVQRCLMFEDEVFLLAAKHLGFNYSIPPFATARDQEILKGVNYASGVAGIREETGQQQGDRISLDRQLRNHQVTVSNITILLGNNESLATAYLNKCIYSVAIGSNDYLNNYFLPQFYPTSRTYNQEQYATVLVQQLSQQLLTLHKLGALKIALFGLGLLGYSPVVLTMCRNNSSCVDNINNAVALFNDKVVTLVNNFNSNLTNAKFIYINVTEISLSSSTSEGFIVTNVPCCEVKKNPQPQALCIPFGTACSNRSQYSFWDAVHPTEVGYVVFGGRAYRAQSPADAYPHDIEHLAQS